MGTEPHVDDRLDRCRLILETLEGPRVLWRDGQPSVDLSAFDRPFAPAVRPSGTTLVARRAAV